MASEITPKQLAALTKESLPILYSHLTQDLEKYRISHESYSYVKNILFKLGVMSRELATQRLNLVRGDLIRNLGSRNIKYVEGRTSINMQSIGSAEIQAVYGEIQTHLTSAMEQNGELTRRHNETPGRLLQAGPGELGAIIDRYLTLVSESIRVLSTYQEGQPDGRYVLSQARFMFDNFLSSSGLRRCQK